MFCNLHFYWSVLFADFWVALCCFNFCHPFHVCYFFCFLSMQAIHNTFFFLFHYFPWTFHSMLCSMYKCSFQLCHYYFVNQCCVVSFAIFLFAKLFVGCQNYTVPPPLPVAKTTVSHSYQVTGYTGSPSITSCWPHRVPFIASGELHRVSIYQRGFPFINKD